MQNGSDHLITTIEALEKLYGDGVYPPAKAKETDHITPAYRKLIEAAPFFALASNGPGGLDCSPRGDPAGFVQGRRREDAAGPGPARQQPHRYAAQPRARSARRAAVPDPGLQRDAARDGPRHDLGRPGAGAAVRHGRQGAAHGARGRGRHRVLPVRQGDRALETVGRVAPCRPQDACRPRARSSPRSPAARSAVPSTTAPRRSG